MKIKRIKNGALVLLMPYVEESSYSQREEEHEWMRKIPINYQEQKFNMDYNTLMLIVDQRGSNPLQI